MDFLIAKIQHINAVPTIINKINNTTIKANPEPLEYPPPLPITHTSLLFAILCMYVLGF